MTYSETLDFLFSQLPMFQRVGKPAFRADLKNTRALMEVLGHPEEKIKTVHIAGTNGKGSVAHLIASVLQEQGYKTGLYTSPHLKDFRERIRVNGELCTENYVVDFVEEHRQVFSELSPSFFEITVAMAFDYFAKCKVDIAVIEVGMGGRLDSTNVLTPEVSVITNIGLDHTAFLGDTIEKIAREKAGIIKREVPVIVGKCSEIVHKVMLDVSKSLAAPIRFVEDYDLRVPPSALKGSYQRDNEETAFMALQILAENGWRLTSGSIRDGFKNVVKHTHFQGRWQTLGEKPLIICDAGHNADGLRVAIAEIHKTPHRELHFVLGVVKDKDVAEMLGMLPTSAHYYFAKADIPRGLPAEELKSKAREFGLRGTVCRSVSEAFDRAKSAANEDDLIFVGGSFFTVAEVLLKFH